MIPAIRRILNLILIKTLVFTQSQELGNEGKCNDDILARYRNIRFGSVWFSIPAEIELLEYRHFKREFIIFELITFLPSKSPPNSKPNTTKNSAAGESLVEPMSDTISKCVRGVGLH